MLVNITNNTNLLFKKLCIVMKDIKRGDQSGHREGVICLILLWWACSELDKIRFEENYKLND